MARYIPTDRPDTLVVEVSLSKQLQPGTFEHAVDYLIENHIDLAVFDGRYRNDHGGRPAWHPKVLLKCILFGYSRGIATSRGLARACSENIVFMALTGGAQPDFTTIAHFVSSMKEETADVFRDVLLYCSELDLISGEMFAIDGHKISSNAAKEWSGTHQSLSEKAEKYRRLMMDLLSRHRDSDHALSEAEANRVRKWERAIGKISAHLKNNPPRMGARNNEIQSNVTDNESAKMPSSHGHIQGYNGVAVVDEKSQIIVHAEAFGSGQEHPLMEPMLEGTRRNLEAIGKAEDCLEGVRVVADTNYYSKENCKLAEESGIDAYIPDHDFRKRDPRFADAKKHKPEKERERKYGEKDFRYEADQDRYICPAGKELRPAHRAKKTKGLVMREYAARESDCVECPLRANCLQKESGKRRFLSIVTSKQEDDYTRRMREKIDSPEGREAYSKRMGIVEPVFGNIRAAKRFDRLTLRGKAKVTIQWMLIAIVHNIEKISHANYMRPEYGYG
jgi:transposase